jgi:predicted O-linked N-acetylglucosamine transferase (SPINDLY family)
LYCATNFPRAADVSSRGSLPEHRALRIGYSAGEFNDHATSYLIAGLLELHDRSRFQIYAVDNGLDDHSEVRRRINASVHQIINIRGLDDTAAVNAIRENEIDILVNLNGYSGRARPGVFALRAAPVQVNYLGFSGTLGAPYIDYIIADPIVLPPDHQKFYDEKVVYLPNCYQVNDRTRPVGTRIPTRAECCLPEKGFVFCCFNNNYKITPDVFSRWARIIEQVSGSVLWLLEDNAGAASNLRMEWSTRGIDPGRLVFAKRAATADHLARHRLADLFLDTSPYGAHTTGSDALWACLPLVTQLGDTFPGRVAASLLHAVGLPELVAATEQDYEQRAVELATNPEQLAAIKLKLAAKRASAPLFDTERFARHVEVAYEMMHERCQAGTPPDHMTVPQQSLQG